MFQKVQRGNPQFTTQFAANNRLASKSEAAQPKLTKPGMNTNLMKVYQITPQNLTSASHQPQWRSFSHFWLGTINGGC